MTGHLVQDQTYSGTDWALEEVTGARYEDCAFHDVDWSEARPPTGPSLRAERG